MKSAVALCGLALAFALPAAASTEVYGPFSFSVQVKTKPELVHGKFSKALVTGSGNGPFFVQGHHMDRDQLVWNVHKPKGGITLYQGGKLLAKLQVTKGVQYEQDGTTFRSVGFKGRLIGGKFHCSKPDAFLTLDDTNPGHGNTDSFQFGACGSYAEWGGSAPKLTVTLKHH